MMYRLYIEWDYGQDDCVFSDPLKAKAWANRVIDWEEFEDPELLSIDDCINLGLASIYRLKLNP